MIRVGELVRHDKNPLMVISQNYETVVKELASMETVSPEKKLLACLVISQTERQYKNYLIKVLLDLAIRSNEELTDDWQNSDLEVDRSRLDFLLSDEEFKLLGGKDIEAHLDDLEKGNPGLFKDDLSNAFYPNKKLGMLYLRRLIRERLEDPDVQGDFERLVIHFVMAQLLISWESSCINLGHMLLEDWNIKKMSEWFCETWPIYYES